MKRKKKYFLKLGETSQQQYWKIGDNRLISSKFLKFIFKLRFHTQNNYQLSILME